jgi:hypothetical protein
LRNDSAVTGLIRAGRFGGPHECSSISVRAVVRLGFLEMTNEETVLRHRRREEFTSPRPSPARLVVA